MTLKYTFRIPIIIEILQRFIMAQSVRGFQVRSLKWEGYKAATQISYCRFKKCLSPRVNGYLYHRYIDQDRAIPLKPRKMYDILFFLFKQILSSIHEVSWCKHCLKIILVSLYFSMVISKYFVSLWHDMNGWNTHFVGEHKSRNCFTLYWCYTNTATKSIHYSRHCKRV